MMVVVFACMLSIAKNCSFSFILFLNQYEYISLHKKCMIYIFIEIVFFSSTTTVLALDFVRNALLHFIDSIGNLHNVIQEVK
jgi:hypothetical protein